MKAPVHLLMSLTLAAALVVVSGCGEDRAARARATVDRDFAHLVQLWNSAEVRELVHHLNGFDYLDDAEDTVTRLNAARYRVGRVVQTGGAPLIDPQPDDPQAYVLAIAPMATEFGVMKLVAAYDESLTIVGFNLQTQEGPAP